MDLLIVSQPPGSAQYKMSFFRGTKSARYMNDLSTLNNGLILNRFGSNFI